MRPSSMGAAFGSSSVIARRRVAVSDAKIWQTSSSQAPFGITSAGTTATTLRWGTAEADYGLSYALLRYVGFRCARAP